MKGNPKVIEKLNEALAEELSAVHQYFVHSEMCENWQYEKLGGITKKRAVQEMKHAEKLIERILFLDGTPVVNKPLVLTIGASVQEQLNNDFKGEVDAIASYNAGIKLARELGDNATAEVFLANLKDEETHADWLESQLHLIKEIGYERYLSKQLEDE